jgi:hypothetical protein
MTIFVFGFMSVLVNPYGIIRLPLQTISLAAEKKEIKKKEKRKKERKTDWNEPNPRPAGL